MSTICVNYTVSYNTYYQDEGFYKAPAPICPFYIYLCLTDVDGTPKTFASGGLIFYSGSDIEVETNHSPCFALTDGTISAYGDVEGWQRNIWDATKEYTCADIGDNLLRFWIGVIDSSDVVKTGDYCEVIAKVEDNKGLCGPV